MRLLSARSEVNAVATIRFEMSTLAQRTSSVFEKAGALLLDSNTAWLGR